MKAIHDTLQLLQTPDIRTRVVTDGYMVPLLPLLEHSHSGAESELRAFLPQLQPPIQYSASEILRRLVLFALQPASEYWATLAAGWLDDGFPCDAAICSSAVALPTSISQHTRHRAFRAATRWERQHNATGNA